MFALANAAFLAVDGIFRGVFEATNSIGGPLANLVGATWCLALLGTAAARFPRALDRTTTLLLAAVWLVFVASAMPVPAAQVLSRVAAIGTAGWLVFRAGVSGLPSALLTFSAVLRQHVGPEASFGILLVGAALAWSATPATLRRR